MSYSSHIEWTEASWNPITGCTKISEGCKYCYAERMAERLKKMGHQKYANGFKLTLHPECLDEPFLWKKSRIIFVCSMSDIFHEDVPIEFIREIFSVMNKASHHIFQVLTKRSKRMKEIASSLEWADNIWLGVTVESQNYIFRIQDLRETPAKIKFVSFEPLLSEISDFPLQGIDWVIVGGESGPKSREMKKEWVYKIRDKCLSSGIPFFFKQWGGVNKKKNGRKLDGKIWNGIPTNKKLQLGHV